MHSLFILPIATYMVCAACLIWNSPNRSLQANGIADRAGGHRTRWFEETSSGWQ